MLIHSIKAPLIPYNLKTGFKNIEIEFLGHHAQKGFRLGEVVIDIDAEHLDAPRGLDDQRTQHADDRRFACPVGPQQGIEISLGHSKINILQCRYAVAVSLGELCGFEGEFQTVSRSNGAGKRVGDSALGRVFQERQDFIGAGRTSDKGL